LPWEKRDGKAGGAKMEILLYGIINSAILALTASGFALVYSISRVANFAHGALYTIAAYSVWFFLRNLGLNYLVAIILGILISALIGAAVYRFLIIRVRGMVLSEVIATYAIGLGILELIRFGGLKMRAYHLQPYIDGKVEIAGVPVDFHRLVIVGITFVVFFLLWAFTHYTKLGLSLRAIAQDERMAMMLGIKSHRSALIALSLGSALAGMAGVVLVPLGTIAVEAGYEALVYAIAVCVLGGLGNWAGAILGAFVIGFAQTITTTSLGGQWQIVVALLMIFIVLLLKPSGLFGTQKELEERV
jgi:branched-chain amino acid transport system permease protein